MSRELSATRKLVAATALLCVLARAVRLPDLVDGHLVGQAGQRDLRLPAVADARPTSASTRTARCSRCSRSRSSTSTACTSPRWSPSARSRWRRWPGTRSPGSGSAAQNALFLVVLTGLLIPSEVTIVPLFQMFNALGPGRHPLAADPGADLRRAERAGDVHHAAVLHRPARRAGGGGPRRRARPVRASSGGSRCRWPARPWARSPSSPSCTAGTCTWSRSSSSPAPEKFTLPQALTQFVDAYGGPMWNVQLSAASLTAIPVLIVFVIAQRQFIEGPGPHGPQGLSPASSGQTAIGSIRPGR